MVEPSSLQVTALLDELLGVGSAQAVEPAAREASNAPTPTGAGASRLNLLCGEIDELSSEMDACIASMGRWEEESRHRREALERELERCYGAGRASLLAVRKRTCEDLDSELENCYGLANGSSTCNAVLLETAEVSPTSSSAGRQDRRVGFQAALQDPVSSAEQILAAAAQVAAEDEARIAKLRAEVEHLKCRQPAEFSTGSTVDIDERRIPAGTEDSIDVDDEISALEGRLEDARNYLDGVEDAIVEANFNVDAEIHELEKLLNDCDTSTLQPTAV